LYQLSGAVKRWVFTASMNGYSYTQHFNPFGKLTQDSAGNWGHKVSEDKVVHKHSDCKSWVSAVAQSGYTGQKHDIFGHSGHNDKSADRDF
jgi:hypothetical protein